MILLNAIDVTCILEQVSEHSNSRAALCRQALKKLAEAEFVVLSLRRSMELRRKVPSRPISPASANRQVRDEVCPPVASTLFAVLDIFFPIIPTSLIH